MQDFSRKKKKKTETCLNIEYFAGDFSCVSSCWSAAETRPVLFPNSHFWQVVSSREEPHSSMGESENQGNTSTGGGDSYLLAFPSEESAAEADP